MYEYSLPNSNRMLVEAAEIACSRLRGVVGEYGNQADKKVLEDLCTQARATRKGSDTVEMNAETLKKMHDALKKTKAALEKLRLRKQDDAA